MTKTDYNPMTITILPFSPEHAPIFDRLNRTWISELFSIEPFDDLVLTSPQKMIIDTGGEIWFAALDGDVIGACALLPFAEGILEFTKLGVDEKARGLGVARRLLRHCRDRAKAKGAHTLKIFTSSKLAPANALYLSEGFIQMEMTAEQKQRYQRADVMYDLALT
jgi:N-acetylglutamate synthase-like GNAT family acetyltransferase